MAKGVEEDIPVVIIIDNTLSRRNDMAAAFEGVAEVQLAYRDLSSGKVRRRSAKGHKLVTLGPALLILRHFRDQKVDPEIQAALTVFYGGNGGSDPDRPEGDPEVIWRQVNAGSGTLNTDEAIEILNYAKAIQKKIPHPEKPAFLKHAYNPVVLPALSILCQGYLAVHAEKIGGEWGPAPIRGALTHMKLPSFFEQSQGSMNVLKDSLPKKRDLVRSPGWWRSVFPKGKKSAEKQITEELAESGISENHPLKKLLDEIFGEKDISAAVVATAYCAVAKKLTGESCQHG